jgi:hypothetical protein
MTALRQEHLFHRTRWLVESGVCLLPGRRALIQTFIPPIGAFGRIVSCEVGFPPTYPLGGSHEAFVHESERAKREYISTASLLTACE